LKKICPASFAPGIRKSDDNPWQAWVLTLRNIYMRILKRCFLVIVLSSVLSLTLSCASLPSGKLTVPAAEKQTAESSNLIQFLSWFEGEFDNNEQVWQQVQTAEKDKQPVKNPFEHIHHLFRKIDAPGVGAHVFFVRQTIAGDPIANKNVGRIYRQRIYRFTETPEASIRLEIFLFKDELAYKDLHLSKDLAASLSLEQLLATPGCDVLWRLDVQGDAFVGTMEKDACKITSRSTGEPIFVNDQLRLTATQLDISDQARDDDGKLVWGRADGLPHQNRKVTYFSGWAAISREPKAEDHTGKYSFQGGIALHNEGDRVQINYDDGKPSGYWLELAQLTYQETKTPILKLALVDEKTNKSVTYMWANTDATRIGMNLKWFQVGLTQKAPDARFADPLVK
jgi:hypothetical protein